MSATADLTEAGRLTQDQLIRAATDERIAALYPDGVEFVAADAEQLHDIVDEVLRAARPLAVVAAHGEEFLVRPEIGRRRLFGLLPPSVRFDIVIREIATGEPKPHWVLEHQREVNLTSLREAHATGCA